MPGIDETQNNFRVRQRDPKEFNENSFRMIRLTDGVKAVIGKLKNNNLTNGVNKMDLEKKIADLETELSAAKNTISDLEAKVTETEKTANDANEKFAAKEKEFEDFKKEIETNELSALKKSEEKFVDDLIAEHKMKPADRDFNLIALEKLRDADDIEFTNSEGKKEKKTAKQEFMNRLSAAEKVVPEGDNYNDGADNDRSAKDAKLSKMAKDRANEKNISLAAATDEILSENPDLNS